jgi:hypothetical protein
MTWVGRTTMLWLAVGVLLVGACGDDSEPDTLETGADDGTSTTAPGTGADESTAAATAGTAATAMAEDTACSDEPPRLHIVNATGNAVEEIVMLACDMTDEVSFPVPPGGLPVGGELTIDLPGPGCWVLQYNGEGCFADPPGMVEAAACETVEWMLTPESHVCAGG